MIDKEICPSCGQAEGKIVYTYFARPPLDESKCGVCGTRWQTVRGSTEVEIVLTADAWVGGDHIIDHGDFTYGHARSLCTPQCGVDG